MSSDSNPLQSLLGAILSSFGSGSGATDEIHRRDHHHATLHRELDGGEEEITADLEAQHELHARRGANRIDVHQSVSESAVFRRRAKPFGRRLVTPEGRRLAGDVDDDALELPRSAELESNAGRIVSYRRTVQRSVTIRGSFSGRSMAELEAKMADELRGELRGELEAPRERQLPRRAPIQLPAAKILEVKPVSSSSSEQKNNPAKKRADE